MVIASWRSLGESVETLIHGERGYLATRSKFVADPVHPCETQEGVLPQTPKLEHNESTVDIKNSALTSRFGHGTAVQRTCGGALGRAYRRSQLELPPICAMNEPPAGPR